MKDGNGTAFWLDAYAGLLDGRASPAAISRAAGRAERVMDPADPDQVAMAQRIRDLYGL